MKIMIGIIPLALILFLVYAAGYYSIRGRVIFYHRDDRDRDSIEH